MVRMCIHHLSVSFINIIINIIAIIHYYRHVNTHYCYYYQYHCR